MKLKNFLLTLSLALFLMPQNSKAQDNYIFNHLSAEVEAGSTGWGISISAPLTRYVTLRTGFTSMPQFSFSGDVKYTSNGNRNEVNVKAKMHMTDFKFLAEIYPFNNCSFHITGGFYLGQEDLLKAKNTEPIDPGDGLEIGDQIVFPENDGVAHAKLKVNTFKPYVGLGFGRSVPVNHRFNVACDLGVEFWGKPKVEAWSPVSSDWLEVSTTKDDDLNKTLNTFSKIKAWPVANIRFIYRLF